MSVVEGLPTMNDEKVAQFYGQFIDSIKAQTEGRGEGHFAIKLTALVSTDVMTKMNTAQNIFLNDILKFQENGTLDIHQLRSSLS